MHPVPLSNPPGQPERRSVPSQPGGVSEDTWAIDHLHRARLRVTSARIEILQIMLHHRDEYLRPEDIARLWLNRNPLASVSAAYRVLAKLAEAGVLCRGRTPEGKAVYALPAAKGNRGLTLRLPDGREIALDDAELRPQIRAALLAGVDVSTLEISISGQKR